MGPPPRSFAADAHDCIMVAILMDRPNTSLRRDLAPIGELPSGRPYRRRLPLCSRPSRAKSLRDGHAATLDRHCAQRRYQPRSGRGDVAASRTKRCETQEWSL